MHGYRSCFDAEWSPTFKSSMNPTFMHGYDASYGSSVPPTPDSLMFTTYLDVQRSLWNSSSQGFLNLSRPNCVPLGSSPFNFDPSYMFPVEPFPLHGKHLNAGDSASFMLDLAENCDPPVLHTTDSGYPFTQNENPLSESVVFSSTPSPSSPSSLHQQDVLLFNSDQQSVEKHNTKRDAANDDPRSFTDTSAMASLCGTVSSCTSGSSVSHDGTTPMLEKSCTFLKRHLGDVSPSDTASTKKMCKLKEDNLLAETGNTNVVAPVSFLPVNNIGVYSDPPVATMCNSGSQNQVSNFNDPPVESTSDVLPSSTMRSVQLDAYSADILQRHKSLWPQTSLMCDPKMLYGFPSVNVVCGSDNDTMRGLKRCFSEEKTLPHSYSFLSNLVPSPSMSSLTRSFSSALVSFSTCVPPGSSSVPMPPWYSPYGSPSQFESFMSMCDINSSPVPASSPPLDNNVKKRRVDAREYSSSLVDDDEDDVVFEKCTCDPVSPPSFSQPLSPTSLVSLGSLNSENSSYTSLKNEKRDMTSYFSPSSKASKAISAIVTSQPSKLVSCSTMPDQHYVEGPESVVTQITPVPSTSNLYFSRLFLPSQGSLLRYGAVSSSRAVDDDNEHQRVPQTKKDPCLSFTTTKNAAGEVKPQLSSTSSDMTPAVLPQLPGGTYQNSRQFRHGLQSSSGADPYSVLRDQCSQGVNQPYRAVVQSTAPMDDGGDVTLATVSVHPSLDVAVAAQDNTQQFRPDYTVSRDGLSLNDTEKLLTQASVVTPPEVKDSMATSIHETTKAPDQGDVQDNGASRIKQLAVNSESDAKAAYQNKEGQPNVHNTPYFSPPCSARESFSTNSDVPSATLTCINPGIIDAANESNYGLEDTILMCKPLNSIPSSSPIEGHVAVPLALGLVKIYDSIFNEEHRLKQRQLDVLLTRFIPEARSSELSSPLHLSGSLFRTMLGSALEVYTQSWHDLSQSQSDLIKTVESRSLECTETTTLLVRCTAIFCAALDHFILDWLSQLQFLGESIPIPPLKKPVYQKLVLKFFEPDILARRNHRVQAISDLFCTLPQLILGCTYPFTHEPSSPTISPSDNPETNGSS